MVRVYGNGDSSTLQVEIKIVAETIKFMEINLAALVMI